MAGERRRLALADVIDLTSGGTPKTNIPDYWDGNIPWLSVGDFNTGYRWVSAAEKSITDRGLSESATTLLNHGDIIISARGTVGIVAQLARPMAFNQSCYGIRGKRGVAETDFIYYTLRHAVSGMKQVAHGGVFDTITRDTFRIIEIDLPPLPEQRAIARILGTLDDKIELNRRMNETLEAIAQAIFKSWFMDTTRDGLPNGWRTVPLPEAVEVNPTRPLRKGEFAAYLDMANMPTRSARALEVYDREFGSGMRFVDGDTLVARITPCLENGKTCFVDFLGPGEIGWGSTEYIVLRPKPPLPPEFAYFLARTEDFRVFAISNMTGTSGRQRVPAECLSNFQIAVPPAEIAERFGEFAHVALSKMKANDEESRTLAAIRDTLLPKLLSGEIRAKQAEALRVE